MIWTKNLNRIAIILLEICITLNAIEDTLSGDNVCTTKWVETHVEFSTDFYMY